MPKYNDTSGTASSGASPSVSGSVASSPQSSGGEKLSALDFMPGVSVLGSILSTIIGNAGTRKNMDKQAQLNLEQWNRENAYNSPAAQMQRYAQAGLNPDLIYGQSNTSGIGNISTEAPAGAKPSFEQAVQSAINVQLAKSQMELNESAAYRNYADADVKPSLGNYYDSGAKRNSAAADLYSAEAETQLYAQQEIMARINNLSAKTAGEIIKNNNLQDWYNHQFDLWASQLDLNTAKTEELLAKTKSILEKLPYEIQLIQASSNKDNALAKYYSRVSETLYDEIWNALAYESGINFDDAGNAEFATKGAKIMSTATQGAERGTKVVKDLISAIMQIATGGKSNLVTETISKTVGPNGTSTTSTWSHQRPPQ